MSHVDGKKVARIEEAVHGIEIDVVRIGEVWFVPSHFRDCGVRGGSDRGRMRTDEQVLTIRFVPHRSDFYAAFRRETAGAQLRLRLMGEAVPNAY
jgi:hypothetical protein